jgi:hypothetical protein
MKGLEMKDRDWLILTGLLVVVFGYDCFILGQAVNEVRHIKQHKANIRELQKCVDQYKLKTNYAYVKVIGKA